MIGFIQLIAPSTLRMTSSDTRIGNARKMSVTRIMTSSKHPPRRPAMAPTATPMNTLMIAEARPMSSDTRMPYSNRL